MGIFINAGFSLPQSAGAIRFICLPAFGRIPLLSGLKGEVRVLTLTFIITFTNVVYTTFVRTIITYTNILIC